MSEREVKQLLKLMEKFSHISEVEEKLNARELSMWNVARQWVRWYGRDALSMDV